MKAHPILLQMKYARIVACYAKMMDISLAEALDQFYRSDTYQLIHEGVSDMHCFSDTYLAEEIKLEYEKKKNIIIAVTPQYYAEIKTLLEEHGYKSEEDFWSMEDFCQKMIFPV